MYRWLACEAAYATSPHPIHKPHEGIGFHRLALTRAAIICVATQSGSRAAMWNRLATQQGFDDMKTTYSVSRARRGAIFAVLLGSSIMPITRAAAAGDIAPGRDVFASRCTACHGLNPTPKIPRGT
jgi:cytochrome c5